MLRETYKYSNSVTMKIDKYLHEYNYSVITTKLQENRL